MAVGVAGRLQEALLAALAGDAGVQAVFGVPARFVERAGEDLAFPHAVVERHEVRPADSAGVAGGEHVLTFSVHSRWDGRADMVQAVQALRAGLEGAEPVVEGARVVLMHALYADVFRASDGRSYRGLLKVRVVVEAA